ncbi:hypothetical protein BUALT_Bualt01G0238900 [Buddleja alternifolia]|uniref:Non-specific lipid-transfer protein n=1 Tax=Buddleja alternifolia TaxID=168488 RepID=A0AAV6YI12_9LAMI|nr:hypothetical protein BUALT_Bualt01G0238900 [Buddleja alternifolia]
MTPRILYVVFAFLFLVSTSATSVPSCGQVVSTLTPCLSYLQGKDPTPSCCSGVKALKTLATTKADRVAICTCGKQALATIKYDPKLLPVLPSKCGIDLTGLSWEMCCNKAK